MLCPLLVEEIGSIPNKQDGHATRCFCRLLLLTKRITKAISLHKLMNGVHELIILLGSFASSYVDGSEQCHISIASSVHARYVF